ncbi:MAG: signal peptide peptidase SppA [Muribaculaceae bacterium]|nr:signal peptide peptidase SppA [Muribaculaceae bacterium]
MLKRFLTSMLGTLAGIWISVGLFFLLFILFILAIGISGAKQTQANIKDNSVLYLDLNSVIDERAPKFDIISKIYNQGNDAVGLNEILYSIEAAANDSHIKGIYINCDLSQSGIATRTEIVKALRNFKKSGKWIYAYGDNYTQGDYYVACAADSIFINPMGAVELKGLSATTQFYKGLLDKLGVEMQIIKVGTFKSAVEPYILTEMSEPSRLQQQQYLGNIWGYLSSDIAAMRKVTVEDVNNWADSIIITEPAQSYIARKIVDALAYRHEVESKMKGLCGINKTDELNLITPAEYFSSKDLLNPDNSSNTIAVLYAVGNIVDQGDEGIVGRTMAPQILKLADDENIKGLILRVNSGGGSAFASEQIWEALEQFKAKGKKFYVSMGDVAASGGYYISCGAHCIYAEPVTLTGSIGIFGVIPCINKLLTDNLGVTQGTVSTNDNGGFISLTEPLTPFQRQKLQVMINNGYENFVGRCATGRSMSVDSIKAIAEGRVWDGKSAFELGLVDKLGGLDMAIKDMAQELGYNKYAIAEYPSLEEELINSLMKGDFNLKSEILKKELGETYQYYQQINYLKDLAPLQCRMEVVEIK